MIAHALKAAFCKCGALSTAKEMAFWGECRRCRIQWLKDREGPGNHHSAVPVSEINYEGGSGKGER